MAQHIKALAIKSVDLRLLPGIYMMQKKLTPKSYHLPSALIHMRAYTHISISMSKYNWCGRS